MSNIKEQIRQEIERLKGICTAQIKANPGQTFPFVMEMTGYDKFLSFIDSLPDENNPEPYNPVYDEDYLNEKIAKATKSWEGVDVDAMLADCRGYEEKPSEDLEEAAEESLEKQGVAELFCGSYEAWQMLEMFKAGSEWRYQKDRREFAKLKAKEWSDGYDEGIAKGKEQMMKDAVEVDVDDLNGEIYNNCIEKGMTGEDKVKMIILKDGE